MNKYYVESFYFNNGNVKGNIITDINKAKHKILIGESHLHFNDYDYYIDTFNTKLQAEMFLGEITWRNK